MAIGMIPLGWSVGIASIGITYISTILAKQPVLANSGLYIVTLIHTVLFRYGLPYLLTVLFSTVVYRTIPTGKVALKSAFVGSIVFSTLMELAKYFFTWYVANYTRYNVIFGSLETVVILVIWVFYVALIFLFCAELISSYQRRDLILLEKALLKPGKGRSGVDERLFRKFGRVYPEGTCICKEGDTGREMYYILSGRVQVEKEAGQVRKLLADLGPGEYFGEMAALIEAPRTASAQAAEDCGVAVISGDTFRNLLRESGEVSLFMLQEFSRRIRHTNIELEALTQFWIRLMAILYFLKEWPLQVYQNPVAELARYTGKDPEEIHEVLRDLGRQGILSLQDDRITGFAKDRAWELMRKQTIE
jgi:CRP-like cAMP-binding protein